MTKFTINPSFEERNQTIISLHKQGHSVSSIAAFVRCSTDIIINIIDSNSDMSKVSVN